MWNKGGSLFEFQTPPPLPSRPPKDFEPVFLQFDILGESVAPKAPKIFFSILRGYFFFTPMCLYSKYSEFVGDSNGYLLSLSSCCMLYNLVPYLQAKAPR